MQIPYLNPNIQFQNKRPNSLINPLTKDKNPAPTRPQRPERQGSLTLKRYSKITERLVKSVGRTVKYGARTALTTSEQQKSRKIKEELTDLRVCTLKGPRKTKILR